MWLAEDLERVAQPLTYTFLFTDVEGSTTRWQADSHTMAKELADHDAILRETITAHGGEMFKHTGDGVRGLRERSVSSGCGSRRTGSAVAAGADGSAHR